MSDLPSPADTREIGTTQRQRFGLTPATAPLGVGKPLLTGVPEADLWLADWQRTNLSRPIDTADQYLIDRIGQTLNGRNVFVPVPQTAEVNLDARPRIEGSVSFDAGKALRHGFDSSTIGALVRWAVTDTSLKFPDEDGYDPWSDPDIQRGPFKGRPELFENSRSRAESAWIMQYMRRREKEASQLEAMTGMPGAFETAGAILGDPLNLVPATLGFKGAMLARRSMALAAPENVALGFKPVVLGGLADGARAASAQAAIALVDAGLHRQLDPTASGGSIADIVALPSAVAGAVGLLVGSMSRYRLGMDALRDAGKPIEPGSLRTDYTAMRAEEMARSPGLREAGVAPEVPVARTIPNEDPRGEWTLETLGGGKIHARDFPPGAVIPAEDGGSFTVVAAKGAGEQPSFRRSAYGEQKPQGSRLVDKEFKPGELDDVEIAKGGGSLSAGGAGAATSRRAQLVGNRMAATGLRLEELPFDVITRAAKSPFTTWQTTVEDLLSSGGRQRVKNQKGSSFEPTALPVEILVKTQWNRPAVEVLRGMRDEWQAYRTGAAAIEPTDAQRVGFELRTTARDAFDGSRFGKGRKGLSFEEFRRRVGDALINGDKDFVTDTATAQVEAAAGKARQLLERIKREGMDVGLFKQAHEEQLAKAMATADGLKKAGASADQLVAAEARIEHIKNLLGDVIAGGPKVKTAASYRPRFWLVDQLRDRADEFKKIVDDWLRSTQPQLSPKARKDIATDIHETLLRDKPAWSKKDVEQQFHDLSDPSNAKARTFEIPDALVKDFLENDAEAIIRSHARTMGTAIEMHRRFGSTGMEDEVAELQNEARLLAAAATTNEAKKKIMKQYDLARDDLLASRDRLYGVYGAPEDPHRWTSRAVRMAKQFTNLTTLGMSGITAMGDLVRPIMTEGLQAVHEYGYRTLASDVRGQILAMSRRELEHAGDAMELILNTRALSMSDAGDAYRSRSPFERGLAKTNSWFFVANGLNFINQIDKEWAGVIIQGNVNRAIQKVYSGGTIEPWMQSRLAAAGIDESMMKRIGTQFVSGPSTARGSNRFGKLLLADTDNWTDDEAAKAYRVALNQMVNRTVPTPTLADTPNWMSTELGSLMTQYKSFAFGAMNRSLIAGLQEETRQFWYGAAAMVGFALILNEIRSRLFYDRSTFDKPMPAVLMDAVDRSSVLGWFSDANRSIEVLTGHRAGIRPFTGMDMPREDSSARVIGAAAGPAAGQAVNALSVLGDFMAMNPTVKTMADARQLIPGQNIPYLDPVLDHTISDGNRWAKQSRPVNGRKKEPAQ